ncbi:MAG: PAS-domain containing protein [Oscillochloridaceae bacterium umkhey_bin13]
MMHDDLQALMAQELPRLHFEAMIQEPPERWVSCNLAASPDGVIWQLSDVTRWQLAETEASSSLQQFRDAMESVREGFALFDPNERLLYWNQRHRTIYATSAEALSHGRSFEAWLQAGIKLGQYAPSTGNEASWLAAHLNAFRHGATLDQQLADGRWIEVAHQRAASGGTLMISSDVTEARQAAELAQQAATQAATIHAQAALLAELSAPLLRISDGVLVLPLIGALDSQRAARIVESLLEAVASQRVHLVILDITGLPVVDTQVANVLIQSARAVRLLGANTVLTGIRPDVAETIVALGISLGDIITRADLQQGVAFALRTAQRR